MSERNALSYQANVIKAGEIWREGMALIRPRYWLLVGMALVAMIINSVPIVCYGPMMCGLSLCLLKLYDDEEIEFNLLFKGFDYFNQSLIAALIVTGIGFGISLLAAGIGVLAVFGGIGIAAAVEPSGGSFGGPAVVGLVIFGYAAFFVLFSVVLAVMHVLTSFAFPLIVERDLEAWPAVKLSWRAGCANFWPLLWVYSLLALAMMLGSMCMYIGLVFVPPIALGIFAVSYRKIFPKTMPPAVAPAAAASEL